MGPPKASGKSTLKNDGRPADKVGQNDYERAAFTPYVGTCGKCGAVSEDSGIGLESTPEEYIANMVAVGREVWRVLRDDGCWFINLGDGYQDKQLQMMPARVALALQADGWYLRSDIIWAKPNPMPESVTDRPTKAHEYVFLLTKRARYFYDADAVREDGAPATGWEKSHVNKSTPSGKGNGQLAKSTRMGNGITGRNRRTVWTIATQPYSGAHFATWPEKLVEPMVKAGTSEHGCCPECGAPWERVTTSKFVPQPDIKDPAKLVRSAAALDASSSWGGSKRGTNSISTTGWQPTCDCRVVVDNPGKLESLEYPAPQPCTVLDPFAGSGTTGVVARRLGRHFVGLDLSYEYLHDQARARLGLAALDAWNSGQGRAVVDAEKPTGALL